MRVVNEKSLLIITALILGWIIGWLIVTDYELPRSGHYASVRGGFAVAPSPHSL